MPKTRNGLVQLNLAQTDSKKKKNAFIILLSLLTFLLLNVANRISDGNLLKAKLGIFVKEQGAHKC